MCYFQGENKMKKVFLVILELVMIISMVSCGSKSVKEQLVGTWKRDSGDDSIAFYEDGNVTAPGYFRALRRWDYIDGKLILIGFTNLKYYLEVIDDDTIKFQDHEWTRIEE